MFRPLFRIITLGIFVVAGSFGIWFYQDNFSARREVEREKEKNRVLSSFVQRLSDEKRVAELLVTDQKIIDDVPCTTLLLVEYDKQGRTLAPKSFDVRGKMVHIDALVIKFDRDFVKQGDGLRGHSIALFTRIYGDKQAPDSGGVIDAPGQIPDVYRDSDPRVGPFEQELWENFWKLARDPELRAQQGVRIANGQGVWGPFEPDTLYTITLESDGGLNYSSEPVKGIYREALKKRAASAQ